MKATESATIHTLYADKPPVDHAAVQRNLDKMHVQYAKQAAAEVTHSLLTKGRATGPCLYDHPSACTVMEDLVFSDTVAVKSLIDLAAGWAGGADDLALGAMCRRMFEAALTISSEKLADQCDDGQVANRFHPGKGDE